jgi:two-component system, sensor histidine kinase and response regulator
MNGVLGMTELALETDLTSEQREYLTMARSSAEALLSIINDVLDFSKIEAGMLELHVVDFRPRENIEETVRTLALAAHQKGLELVCDIDNSVPHTLLGDPLRIRQVLVNLVGNAIKFTQQGEIVIGVQAHPGPAVNPSQLELRFAVRDTGIGIAPEKLDAIFQAFTQADSSTTRQYGGTGLGLTISKRLVEMMGGHIKVESELKRGSIFSFTAQVGVVHAAAAAPVLNPARLSGVPVLVVDDNATNRRVLCEWLTQWGMWPVVAESGPAALKLLESVVHPIPLVLTDVHMPDMDGFELLKEIKIHSGIPTVIMLTSGSYAGDVARSRELGAEASAGEPAARWENGHPSPRAETTSSGGPRQGPRPSCSGCGRQPHQSAIRLERIREGGVFRGCGEQRARGARCHGARVLRSGSHGRTYAGDGRVRSHQRHSCAREVSGDPSSHHRGNGSRYVR